MHYILLTNLTYNGRIAGIISIAKIKYPASYRSRFWASGKLEMGALFPPTTTVTSRCFRTIFENGNCTPNDVRIHV
jgi:hypothetical protein